MTEQSKGASAAPPRKPILRRLSDWLRTSPLDAWYMELALADGHVLMRHEEEALAQGRVLRESQRVQIEKALCALVVEGVGASSLQEARIALVTQFLELNRSSATPAEGVPEVAAMICDPAAQVEEEADAMLRLAPIAISGPYDGMVEIFSCFDEAPLRISVNHVDLLISALSSLDRTESLPRKASPDPSS